VNDPFAFVGDLRIGSRGNRRRFPRVVATRESGSADHLPAVTRSAPTSDVLIEDFAMLGQDSRILKFLQGEDGPTAVEYAVMLALIIVACISIIQNLGLDRRGPFSSASSAIAS
jgi:pilus assembly protein Flp/PilA